MSNYLSENRGRPIILYQLESADGLKSEIKVANCFGPKILTAPHNGMRAANKVMLDSVDLDAGTYNAREYEFIASDNAILVYYRERAK